jgi:hypothetical protein
MAGTLSLGGMADGLLVGQVIIGPSTMGGKAAISEIINVSLEANVDFAIKVPAEAVAYAVTFTFASAPAEVKIGSNLITTTNGMPVPASGWLCNPLYSTITELKFKAATPPSIFQVVFI